MNKEDPSISYPPLDVPPPATACQYHPVGGGAANSTNRKALARKRIATTVKTEWRARVAELIAQRGLRGPFYEDVRLDADTWTCAVSAVHPVNGHTLHVLCSDTIKAPHPVHAPALERAAQRLFEALDDTPTLFFDHAQEPVARLV